MALRRTGSYFLPFFFAFFAAFFFFGMALTPFPIRVVPARAPRGADSRIDRLGASGTTEGPQDCDDQTGLRITPDDRAASRHCEPGSSSPGMMTRCRRAPPPDATGRVVIDRRVDDRVRTS